MHKNLLLLRRRPDLERAAFLAWWLERHARRVERLQGLRRYTASVEAAGEEAPFDGVAELWFDDPDAAAAAWRSEAGHEIDADMHAHASRVERLNVIEHPFVDRSPARFKLIAALKRRDDLSRPEFARWWLERHAPLVVVFPELLRYRVNIVAAGPECFVDGVAEVGFADLETLMRITSTAQVKGVQRDSQLHTSARYRLLAKEIAIVQ